MTKSLNDNRKTVSISKPGLWTRAFINLTLINFFVAFNFYLLMVVIAGYSMDTFGASPSIAGLTTGIFVIGGMVSRLLLGRWIERIGRKKMLFWGLIFSITITLLYFAVNNIFFLIIVRFLHGASFGIIVTVITTIVTDIIPKNRLGEGLAYFALSTTIATAIAPFLSIVLNQHGGFNIILIVAAVAIALGIVNALLSTINEIKLTEEQLTEMKGFKLSHFFEPKVIPIAIICMTSYICYSSIISFLAKFSEQIHVVDAASFFFLVLAVAALCSRPFIGKIFDSKGENVIMYSAILALSIGLVGVSQAHQGYSLLFAGAIFGLGLGAILPCCQAIYIKLIPQHRIAVGTATFFSFMDFGVGIGPFIFGLFIPLFDYRGMYMAAAILSTFCIFLYFLLHGRNRAVIK